MPEIASKTSAPQRRSVHVPGIFEAWHYCRCSWLAVPMEVELEHLDDRAVRGEDAAGAYTLDVGTTKAYLQAAAPRVACEEHGVVVAHVQWARPGAKHTWLFEDTLPWTWTTPPSSVRSVRPNTQQHTVPDMWRPPGQTVGRQVTFTKSFAVQYTWS